VISDTDLAHAAWRKSSRSGGGNNCAEVAKIGDVCAIRDSKDPTGPALAFADAEWKSFTADVEDGKLDLA